MHLNDLRDTIINSRPDDWTAVSDGPLYLGRISPSYGAGGASIVVDSHYRLAIYNEDVDLRLAWGLVAATGLSYPNLKWPDPTINRIYVDAFWGGALVARWTLLDVDGHRCYLPELSHPPTGWTVTCSEEKLARLVQTLGSGRDDEYEGYLKQTRAVVVSG